MMISFLAALRDGVTFGDTTTRRTVQGTTTEREGTAGIRLPALMSLLGFDASGRMGRKEEGEASEETQAVRQHTSASLFNALYEVLLDDGILSTIESSDDLDGSSVGDIVEIAGEFVGNPLEPMMAFFKQALPYFEISREGDVQPTIDLEAVQGQVAAATIEADDLRERANAASRSGNPATRASAVGVQQQSDLARRRAADLLESAQAVIAELMERHQQQLGIRMLAQVGEELATTPVQDTVINGAGFKAVLTMSTEFFTDATRAYLRAGSFRAVGKVTRILKEKDEVNLLRRTVLGATGAEFCRDLLTKTVEEGRLQLETFDPIIKAPAAQVLPLAVFV